MKKEFVYITKAKPDFVDSIDPVFDLRETENQIEVVGEHTYVLGKSELLAWGLRDFTRDEDGKTPPPKETP